MTTTTTQNNIDAIKVATFNLRRDFIFDFNRRWNVRSNIAVDIIKQSCADIIGVQELLPLMKDDLKSKLTEYYFIGNGRCKKQMNEHSDIIINNKKFEIDSYETFWLSRKPDVPGSRLMTAMFPRICTAAIIKYNGKRIRVYNTHLDNVSPWARLYSIDLILENIKHQNEIEQMPVILTGDFNARPDSKVIYKLMNNDCIKLINVFTGEGTYHGMRYKYGKYYHRQYDYIFVSDDINVNAVYLDKTVHDNIYPSDHYPLIAELVI